jgi:hypothetical protein
MQPAQPSISTNQQAQLLSSRLGELAANLHARPQQPSRLATILGHLKQRRSRQEEAIDKLKAEHFIMTD